MIKYYKQKWLDQFWKERNMADSSSSQPEVWMKKQLIEGVVLCGGLLWMSTLNFKELSNMELAASYILGILLISFIVRVFRSRAPK